MRRVTISGITYDLLAALGAATVGMIVAYLGLLGAAIAGVI